MDIWEELTLNDMLHVPDIRKNLISGSILSKEGFRMVFESDKFVLTKGGMYVGKGYLVDGLFKASVAVEDKKSVYLYPKLINKESLLFICLSLLFYGMLIRAYKLQVFKKTCLI